MSQKNRFFKVIRGSQHGPRLIIFPYAGAGAYSSARWVPEFSKDVELCSIQRAGREDRFDEDPSSSLDTCLAESGAALEFQLDRPYSLFGHSLGGFLAYQTTAWILKHDLPPPETLFISAISPTIRSENHTRARKAYSRFMLGAIEDPIFDVDQDTRTELSRKSMAAYESDLKLYFESEADAFWPLLNIPIVVFHGTRDDIAPRETVLEWQRYTSQPLAAVEIDGEHMFVETPGRSLMAKTISHKLRITPN
ncbi:thioesterase [Oxalobacteraceae bacterium CAVE-383]|nr:thioesterase [Oxalobacteraceae bacterium CAVE-383]